MRFEPLTEQNFHTLLHLLLERDGAWASGEDFRRRYYEWKYLDRPKSMHRLPSAYLVFGDSGEPLGCCGQIPFWHEGMGPTREGGWIADYFVRPSAKGQGAGTALLRHVLQTRAVVGCLVASDEAERIYAKLGMVSSEGSKLFHLPLRRARFDASKQTTAPRKLAAWVRGALRGAPTTPTASIPEGWAVNYMARVEDATQVPGGDPFAGFRHARRTPDVIAYFMRYPLPGSRAGVVTHAGEVAGHVVYRTELDARGLVRGRIVDIVAPLHLPAWQGCVAHAVQRMSEAGVDYIDAIASHPMQTEALTTQGFELRASRRIWCFDHVASARTVDPWLTSFLDKDNAHRGAMLGPT